MIAFKVREDQEKRRIEEEQQSQLLTAQQPGQSSVEAPQPASYVSSQLSQHSTQMSAQATSQQSLQGNNYNTSQSTQLTGLAQGVPFVSPACQVQGQSLAAIQPESEEPASDQHQQQQHTGGGLYLRGPAVTCTPGSSLSRSVNMLPCDRPTCSHSHGRQTTWLLSPP